MKVRALLLSALLLAPAARAAIALQFSGGSTRASNWQSYSGYPQMVWGIVVDTDHDGFLPNTYHPGFSYADAVNGVFLESGLFGSSASVTDDLLLLHVTLMPVTSSITDGNPAGTNYITSLSINTHLSEISEAPFQIIWFNHDNFPTLSGIAHPMTAYGMFEIPGAILPADGGATSFTTFFAGSDPLKPQPYFLVFPEPSSALLCLCGLALLLLRRRAVGRRIA